MDREVSCEYIREGNPEQSILLPYKEYLEYAKVNKKSWKSDQTSLSNLKSFFKEMRLSKITPRLIEEYKQERIQKVKPASVNRELACLKSMYSLAKKWKLADENPVKEVKLFQKSQINSKLMTNVKVQISKCFVIWILTFI